MCEPRPRPLFARPASSGDRWAIVLAAGEGRRLQSLTVDLRGTVVPKQFCTLLGQRSLLEQSLDRAAMHVRRDRIVVVVAAEHERFWRGHPFGLSSGNVIVQPRNRGTANGLLLGLCDVLRRDADATVAVMPADQHVTDETTLGAALAAAFEGAARGDADLVLLGLKPERPIGDYGWIEPGARLGPFRRVAGFVEKPGAAASHLMARGDLWNSFLFTGHGPRLVRRIEAGARADWLLRRMRDAQLLGQDALDRLYEVLPVVDMSRDVLQADPQGVAVLEVPPCGWTDLGTADRLALCLAELEPDVLARACGRPHGKTVNLARRLQEHTVVQFA